MPSSCTDIALKPEVVFPVLDLPKLELCFRDGTSLWLRQVNTDPLQRSLNHRGELLEVDLRRISPMLEDEVFQAPPRDKPAVIFFRLRERFMSADAFIEAVHALHGTTRTGLCA